ncbi:50S ribosomal protein L1 [Xylaria bambusicola]|uniref:50S ribosomal protein L1 n=1 Tax=Xylaria bambusicola TaxID=326684 RepID=UPI002008CC29|nr:50S ribosomal protein L1 [Xylaria bambusicola]KAI0508985.1 50S ribosomal protein L1 [Xylaria bambusicola]
MVTTNQCVASLARLNLSSMARPTAATIPRLLAPSSTSQVRWKSVGTRAMQAREREKEKLKKKRRQQRFKEYKYAAPSREEQFSLCDAMRYLRAAEVGRPPSSATYELALKVRTIKNGPVLRDRIRLPFPVKNDTRIAVICKENSGAAHEAKAAGAVAFGEESLFEMIKANPNKLPFNRLICHADSEPALKKANLGRILGPKGLMPSLKTNTITKSVVSMMHDMVGAENYREKIGAIRMPIGNIQFTPRMLSENIKTMINSVKGNITVLEDRVRKDLVEVVLTSTSGPGFSLNGLFVSTDKDLTPAHLSTAM